MPKTKIFIILFSLALAISACLKTHSDDQSLSNVDSEECIPPLTTFAYQVNAPRSTLSWNQILPHSPWQVETHLPALPPNTRSRDAIVLHRTYDGIDEIWVVRNITSTVDILSKTITELLVYQPETQTWNEIPTELSVLDATLYDVYMGMDGTIWAEFATEPFPVPHGERFIAIYNQDENLFKLVKDLRNLQYAVIKFDPKGTFWIVVDYTGIYSFNPTTQEYKLNLAISDRLAYGNPRGVAIAPDGSLYLAKWNEILTEPTILLHYIPDTGELVEINVPLTSIDNFYDVFVDHSGRLWLDDLGWMEPNGSWYQIVRSPIFISNKQEEARPYTWPTAQLYFESSDGRLWFGSTNGEAWLDPDNGKWCLFTTEHAGVTEDHNQVVWAVIDELLYKLFLSP